MELHLVRLDRPAYELLLEWFDTFPDERVKEAHFHGVDPVRFPDDFFQSELQEPIHEEILKKVIKNRGVVTRPMIKKWTEQELAKEEYEE